MKAKDLDKMFDSGKVDITPYLDLESTARPGYEQKRIKSHNFVLSLLVLMAWELV